ncbi:DUF302 domain-containing protein [Chitinivibrio alkaliphilus]
MILTVFLAMGSVATVFAHDHGQQPDPVIVQPSERGFAETVSAFKDEVSQAGWSVLNVNNMAGVLSSRGYTMQPVVIIDVCSGQYSARILSEDAYRPVSAFMPCRVSIYKTADGTVFFSRMNAGAFGSMMDPEVAEVMEQSDAEISEIIDRARR